MDGLKRRAGWALLAAVACAMIGASVVRAPLGGWAIAIFVAFAAVSAWRPLSGLLLYAGLAPLTTVLFLVAAPRAQGFPFAEGLAITLIGGWALHRCIDPRPPASGAALRQLAILMIALALAWAVIEVAVLQAQTPGTIALAFAREAIVGYLPSFSAGTARPAVLWIEFLLLLLVAADVTADGPANQSAVLRMMAAGAAGAAALSVLRYVQVVLSQADPLQVAGHYFAHIRVSVQFPDVNAAGSYFAMMLVIAAGLTTRHRRWPAAAAALCALGVWFSGSRFALGSAILGVAIAALLYSRGRGRSAVLPIAITLAVICAGTAAGWKLYPEGRNFLAGKALLIRTGLARGGLEMARDHPLAGVGPGHFYLLSNEYAADAIVPFGLQHENAHNNFIQVLAEFGVPGLALFLGLVVLALRQEIRRSRELSLASLGLIGGVAAYLISCVGGHPLLIPEPAFPFWLALGVLAPAGVGDRGPAPRALRLLALLGIAALVVSLPWRVRHAIETADMSAVDSGLSAWQMDPARQRYRTAGAAAMFHVPAGAKMMRLPLRSTRSAGEPLEIAISLDGRDADRVRVPADGEWHTERLMLRGRNAGPAYLRVELRVLGARDGAGGEELLMVGRPELDWGR